MMMATSVVMLGLHFLSWSLLLVLLAGGNRSEDVDGIPSWLANNPGFQRPKETDAIRSGNGTISAEGRNDQGWLVHCNDKRGHGIEVEFGNLSLDSDSDEFLMIAPWPLSGTLKQIRLLTGRFRHPPKRLRIPNTKSFHVVYSASGEASNMTLKYRRYGSSLELVPPPTDNPVKKKETVFEIQLRGKPPDDYSHPDFSPRFKNALRATARRYSAAHQIPFNDSIPTDQMVRVHKVSFCPVEWPDRNDCASVEHSVFVSGVPVSDEGLIADYQLTADHLKVMWAEGDFPELEELGVTVFRLPRTSSTVLYWSLIIGFMAGLSLLGSFVFWRGKYGEEVSSRRTSGEKEVQQRRRPKLKLGKRERVPSFMYGRAEEMPRMVKEEVVAREASGDSSELPMKNYFGSILFGSNRAFEDDEDGQIELRPKPPMK